MSQMSFEGGWEEMDPALEVDRSTLLSKLQALRAAYERGDFGGTVHEVHPDLAIDSRAHYLYFTLAPSLNFQRKSEALWRAADATYQDPDTRFVFFPENVEMGKDAYLDALSKYSLATFREKHTDIWFTISTTLATGFDADPRVLLERAHYDVPAIKAMVRERKREFPYLSGPKLLNYWLYMLVSFTDAPLVNRAAISIIPDVHVMAASVYLGVVPEATDDRELVAEAWNRLLAGSDLTPIDLHGPLWRWARLGYPDVDV